MKYEKPEVTLLGEALVAIQKHHKGSIESFDGQLCTVNAYEADE